MAGIADTPSAFATRLAGKLAASPEERGEVEAALRYHGRVLATAIANDSGARATQARADPRAFAERHAAALGNAAPSPNGPPSPPALAPQACEAIWAEWQGHDSSKGASPGIVG